MRAAGKKNFIRDLIWRLFTAVFIMTLIFPYFSDLQPANKAEAAKVLRLSQCKSIAVKNNEKIEAIDIQIEAKEAAKQSAVRAISEKYKNMQTFRWSPLLNFKFPESPNEAEDYEFKYKPIQLQSEIDTLKHKKNDLKLEVYEKVGNIYIDIITSTMEISFLKERIANMDSTIKKNKARLIEGTATQAQIDQQQDKLNGFNNSLTSEQTKLQRAKEKLGRELGFDVTVGYTFEEVFISSKLSRDCIPSLQNVAMATSMSQAQDIMNETVYEAKQQEELAKLSLNTNSELLKGQYGGKYNMISGYIAQALDGSKLNKRAFRKDYDTFLKDIDQPWQGSKKILFFRFPKVWWKGEIDGIRYVEDDPYVLYSAALEYESALKEYNNARTELANTISDGYDNYIETRNAYLTAMNELLDLQNKLIYDEALNALGQLSLEEYETELTEYENARTALKDALSLYSSTLYEYDRTCCGGVSKYFVEEALSTVVGDGGLGTVEDKEDVEDDISSLNITVQKGAIYSIRSIVDSQEFMLYIDIPEGFDYNITDFELWSDGRQIGERTPAGEAIRHLTITVQDVDSVFIRLYDNTTFIDDCAIDPVVATGPLNIREASLPKEEDETKVIGSYTVEEDSNTDMIRLRFTFDTKAVEKNFPLGSVVKYYNLSAERNLYLFSDELVDQDQPFSYMSFIKNDLAKLTLRLFAEDGSYIGGADFDTAKRRLVANTDVTEADMQEMAARELVKERKSAEIESELSRMEELLNTALMANGGEADTATITYYKQRVEALREQLDNVGNSITDEEVRDCLESDGALVSQMAAQMSREDEEEQQAEAGLSQEEANARAVILKQAAEEVAKKLKAEEMAKSIDASLNEKKKELFALQAELDDGKLSGAEAERIKEQISAIQKEISNLNAKKDALNAEESAVSDEDIQAVLKDHPDMVYSEAADKLSNAMLYGSETGQYCIALLENKGLPVTEENVRLVMQNAGNIDTYEAMNSRLAVLQKEMAEAKQKAEKLRENDPSVTEQSLAGQLDKIEKAYSAEIKKLEKAIKKNDPAKEVILKDYKRERDELLARIEADKAARSTLICYNYSKAEYTREETSDYITAETWLNTLKKQKENERNNMNDELNTLQELVDNKDNAVANHDALIAALNTRLALLKSSRDQRSAEYEHSKKWYISKSTENACRQAYEAAEAAVRAQQAKIDDENAKFVALMGDIAAAPEKIAALKEELAGLDDKYAERIAAAEAEWKRASESLQKAVKEWEDSVPVREKYDADIQSCEERVTELNALIGEYY